MVYVWIMGNDSANWIRKGTTMKDVRGFTLLELLLSIAIIAVLMAILSPVLGHARLQARTTACRSQLRHWSIIWTMYCDDNNGSFPGIAQIGWMRGEWILPMRPQWHTNTDILKCPMATKRNPEGIAAGSSTNTYIMGAGGAGDLREECSYGMNCWLYDPPRSITKIQNRPTKYNWRRVGVAGSAEIPVFADAMWRGGGPMEKGVKGDPPAFTDQWAGAGHEMKHFCIDRHDGHINMLFLDWSARKVGLKELWTLKWRRNWGKNDDGSPDPSPWTAAGGVLPEDWPDWMRDFREY